MSFAFKPDNTPEYATRTEVHYMLRVPMSAIAKAIREGRLATHLMDNKVQINVAEARQVFGEKQIQSLCVMGRCYVKRIRSVPCSVKGRCNQSLC